MQLSNLNILLLLSSLFAFEFNADAGDDIDQFVSPCGGLTSVQLNGSLSIDILGVCDNGSCSKPIFCDDNSDLNDADCLDQFEGDFCNDGNNVCIEPNDEDSCLLGGYEWASEYDLTIESECTDGGTWIEFSENDYVYQWSSGNDEVSFVNNGQEISTVIIPEVEGTLDINIYLSIANPYLGESSAQDTLIISVDSVIPCANSGDEIQENCLSCLNENSSIYNLGVGKCDIMKICEPFSLICDDLSGINDDDCLDQIEGDQCNDGNNQCASVLCEIENESECIDSNGNWVSISEYHKNTSDGYYLLDPFNSYDYYNNELTYAWELSELFSIDDGHRVAIINPSEIKLTKYPFILTVSNGTYESSDTTYLNFDISAPIIPTIYAKADSGKIIINWTNEAINSVDSLTGYRDFEGFRIYKSTDGGETWGGPDDRIYYNGEAKGWNPLAQFDLSVEEDSLFSLKDIDYEIDEEDMVCTGDLITPCDGNTLDECENNGKCTNPNLRFSGISGIGPLAPWVNLGENTGLEYTYTDNDVYNGKEYTYAVVSYDMGLRAYELSYVTPENNSGICTASDNSESMLTQEDCCSANAGAWDTELDRCTYSDCTVCSWEKLFNQVQDWDVTNPDHFSDSDDNGYASVECDITEINMVTAIPGFYAENVENISFEGVENADGIILQAEDQTIGNGLKSFMIVNQDDLTESVYRFEIQATELPFNNVSLTGNVFEGYKTSDPSLYVYEINNSTDKEPVNYHIYEMVVSEFADIINLLKISLPDVCNTNPIFYSIFNEEACIDLLGEKLLDLPGVVYSDAIGYTVPEYVFSNFQLKFIDDLSYSSNFTDFIDGLKFRFDNSLRSVPLSLDASIKSIKYISGTSIDSGTPDTLEIENNNLFSVKLKYGNTGGAFYMKPPYSYKIKFKTTPQYPVYITEPSEDECGNFDAVREEWFDFSSEFSESGNTGPTLLPFEVYNLTTGALVRATHSDFGSMRGEDDDNCIDDCGNEKWCNNGECQLLKGYKDCYWGKNENIAFTDDPVNTTETIMNVVDLCGDECTDLQWCSADDPSTLDDEASDCTPLNGDFASDCTIGYCTDLAQYTFDLQINFSNPYGQSGAPYDPSITYSSGDIVRRNAMQWRATSSISPNIEPTFWIDVDSDGINDNPWQPVYGWEDGDVIIIEPTRWYVDGDAWIADFSQIGRKLAFDKEDLSNISVVPNPYFSHSRFDETASSRLMWFTHLPTYCYISIYTVSGELVTSFEHKDEFSGQESWNLRSGYGDEVAPGLYIYTVESGSYSSKEDKYKFKHIGKFAIVR